MQVLNAFAYAGAGGPLDLYISTRALAAQTAPDVDWSVFVATLLWNYQGWGGSRARAWVRGGGWLTVRLADGLGTIAGEVVDGGRTYPLGVVASLVLMSGAGYPPDTPPPPARGVNAPTGLTAQ